MTALWVLTAYGLVALANVIASAIGNSAVEGLTKPLLMPLLMVWLLVVVRAGGGFDTALRWLAGGVVAAWLGDLLLMGDGDLWFAGGLAAFLVMQVCYLVAFSRIPGPGLVRAWKIALAPFVLAWLVLNALVLPGAGDLRIPVFVYSTVLILMAVSALDLVLRVPRPLGWRVAWGAILFVVSDAIIALTAFGPLSESGWTSAAVMATYTLAQAMIVTGFAGAALATRHDPVRR